ncbi:MAG: XylR N-terminal domain-containing protein [Promethearchaeota archaeon]
MSLTSDSDEDDLYSVIVPKDIKNFFLKSQKRIEGIFNKIERKPEEGRIFIDKERYLFLNARSLSVCFLEETKKMFGSETAELLLYNYAYSIGRMEARKFINKYQLKDPIEKLSMGPVYFAFNGLAKVHIFPQSRITPDENFLLIYEHPNTFESELFIQENRKMDHEICFFSAGYSAGWCSEAFNLNLMSKEILCKAKGDKSCRFIMAYETKIMDILEDEEMYKELEDKT